MRFGSRRIQWGLGLAWLLSWFELYLEIYRHRHVSAPRLLPAPALPLDVPVGAQRGWWLLTILTCAAVAPCAFAMLVVWRHVRGTPLGTAPVEPPFPLASATAGFGLLLIAMGALNQLLRRPPFTVDLTLRAGNGGFLVIGVVLAGAGLAISLARRARPTGA